MPELNMNKPKKGTKKPKKVEAIVTFTITHYLSCPQCGLRLAQDSTSREAVLGDHECNKCGIIVTGVSPALSTKDGRGTRWNDVELELKIISYVDYHEGVSGRELERQLDIPHGTALRCIKNLISQGLLERRGRGLWPL